MAWQPFQKIFKHPVISINMCIIKPGSKSVIFDLPHLQLFPSSILRQSMILKPSVIFTSNCSFPRFYLSLSFLIEAFHFFHYTSLSLSLSLSLSQLIGLKVFRSLYRFSPKIFYFFNIFPINSFFIPQRAKQVGR